MSMSGPHPVDGGASRAWLITDTGIICGIDLGVVGSGTMLGIDNSADLNGDGATVSYTANTMTDTAATLHASMEGAYIHVYHAATQTYERRLISGVNVGTDTLTVGAAWTLTPAAGSRYTISPIPYKLRLWPLPSPAAPAETGRKLVRDMALNVTGYAGVAGNPNAVWRVGVCRNGEAEPSAEIEEVGMAVDPQDQHANVNRDGHMLEPWVENISAGTDFELLNVTIDATITGSRKIG